MESACRDVPRAEHAINYSLWIFWDIRGWSDFAFAGCSVFLPWRTKPPPGTLRVFRRLSHVRTRNDLVTVTNRDLLPHRFASVYLGFRVPWIEHQLSNTSRVRSPCQSDGAAEAFSEDTLHWYSIHRRRTCHHTDAHRRRTDRYGATKTKSFRTARRRDNCRLKRLRYFHINRSYGEILRIYP